MPESGRWTPYVASFGALLVLLTVAWWVGSRAPSAGVGDPVPEVAATDLDGTSVSARELRGQVVLLNVWATWCAPCREEMPSMQALQDAFAGEPFQVVAVSVDTGRDGLQVRSLIEAFAEELELDFSLWHDVHGTVRRRLGTVGIPETFLIDGDGVIRERVVGAVEWDEPRWVERVEALIAELQRGRG